ncbi:MAG: hypothetical protein J1F67_07835 [Muribaculaceae bacterium]|nr:hypothetical protein [Muribaculaceae bacterium]
MKLTKHLFGVVLTAITAGALVSCTNEFSESGFKKDDLSSLKMVKTPEVYAWSGEQTLSSSDVITRGTDMNANMWDQRWDCPPRPAEDLLPEELAELKELLSPGNPVKNTVVIPFENYYVQQIFKGTDTYHTMDRCNGEDCDHKNDQTELGSGHMDLLLAFNNILENDWDIYGRHQFNETMYEHVNNFNNGTNDNKDPSECGCGEKHYQTTLMTGMPTSEIDPDKQFGFHETWGSSPKYYNNYLIVEYKGYYYVGFDYEAHKNDQTTHNHGEGLDIERDWNFTDWIVRITPAYPKGTNSDNPGGVTGSTQNPETCPKPNCPHEKHDNEKCDECEPGTVCHPAVCEKCGHGVIWDNLQGKFIHVATSQNDPGKCGECESLENESECTDGEIVALDDSNNVLGSNTTQGSPSTPSTPGNLNKPQNEVEVNLSILDTHSKYDINDLVSKLSIHVRYPRDVEVILPVPANIYCDQDDLYILKDHYDTNGEPNWAYDGEYHNVVYDIDGNTVELHVEFVAPANDYITAQKTGFIRVYTVGINEDVIAYLNKNFGDGINFEVYNYYNRGNMYTTGNYAKIGIEALQGYLNHSMINFDWEELMADRKYPNFYIMAFNELDKDAATGDGDINEKDCYVWIFGDDRANPSNDNYPDGFYNTDAIYSYSRNLTTNWFSSNEKDIKENNERSHFYNAYKGTHYNSSKYNWIFTNKSVTGSVEPKEDAMPAEFPFQ